MSRHPFEIHAKLRCLRGRNMGSRAGQDLLRRLERHYEQRPDALRPLKLAADAKPESMTWADIGSVLAMGLLVALVLFVLFFGDLFIPGGVL